MSNPFDRMNDASTYSSRRQMRDAYRDLLHEIICPELDLDVHFIFNRSVTGAGFERTLDELLHRIDRYCLGNQFDKKEPSERSSLIVFTEHPQSNRHGHGFLRPGRLRDGEVVADYRAQCSRIWKRLEGAGNLDIAPIQTPSGAIIYNTKDLVRPGACDLIYVRGDWSPVK